jgi:hypothetical protein
VRELLSQETRYLLLGHPTHLTPLAELDDMIPKNEAASSTSTCRTNVSERGLPSKFWEPTEHGVEILYEHNFLRGVPIARAVYGETHKSERVRRH